MEVTTMEKECEICGAFFTATTKKQKYCPDCKIHSGQKKKAMERNILISIDKYKDIEKPVTCKCCGTTFMRPASSTADDFCGAACKKQYVFKRLRCTECGRNLSELGFTEDPGRYHRFCSPECERKFAERRKARKAAPKKTAEQPRQDEPRQEFCLTCGRLFWKTGDLLFCSEKCHKAFLDGMKQESLRAEKKKEAAKKAKAEAYAAKNGLCPTCRTPYKNCERMLTGFTALPEGAVSSGSIVTVCPKYK